MASPICRVLVCILAGILPCMPRPSLSKIAHAAVAISCDSGANHDQGTFFLQYLAEEGDILGTSFVRRWLRGLVVLGGG